MPETTQQRERHTPLVLVETVDLPRDDWLNYRRRGIGGSDVAAIMGVSPFRTARDIYYDKLGVAVVEPDDSNWVALEVGHLLEDLVAKIFSKKPDEDGFSGSAEMLKGDTINSVTVISCKLAYEIDTKGFISLYTFSRC